MNFSFKAPQGQLSRWLEVYHNTISKLFTEKAKNMAMPMLSVSCGARARPVIVMMQMYLLKLSRVVLANTAPNNMNSGVTLTIQLITS